MPSTELLATAALLAVLVNGLVEYIFKTAFDKLQWDSWWLMYVSLAVGVLVALVYNVDLLAYLVQPSNALQHYAGIVLSGLVMGRGANYLADLPWLKPSLK